MSNVELLVEVFVTVTVVLSTYVDEDDVLLWLFSNGRLTDNRSDDSDVLSRVAELGYDKSIITSISL